MFKKVAIIGSVGIPAKYGGFETLVEYLTKYLSSKLEFIVYCSNKSYPEKSRSHNNARLRYIPLNANGIQSIPYDIISIVHALFIADTLLILGVSGCCILPFVRLFTKKKILVNIDGLEWKRNKWGFFAKYFLKYSEKLAVKYSDIIIADNIEIQKYINQCYGKDSKYISYGGDHANYLTMTSNTLECFPFLKKEYAFKICRIEPENNIEVILKAFSEYNAKQIVLIGNWEDSKYGIELKNKYSNFNNIQLLDPIYEIDILNQIRSNCLFYIHGHSAGGTNPSLVEAMYLKLPILAFDCSFNRSTTDNRCLYFEDTVDLVKKIKKLNKDQLSKISEDIYNYANEKYRWDLITTKYLDLFN
jgi:glycosyltransferase involved in cell wall biosynthesis